MHLVMLFHRRQQAAHHVTALLHFGLADVDGLKPPGKCRVLLDVLTIFRPGRGCNRAQRAPRQCRFQKVGGVSSASGTACPDQGVGFIDEKDDGNGRGLHLVNHRAQALLEFAFH